MGAVTSDIIPVTPGAFQSKFNGGTCGSTQFNNGTAVMPIPCRHGFAAKISADGTKLLYATYLEGSQEEFVLPIGVDASGDLYIQADFASADFPTTASIAGLPPTAGTGGNPFILELSPDGSKLVFSDTFAFPGVPAVSSFTAVLRPNGRLIFAGTTDGTAFPTTSGAYLHARGTASLDGFVFEWDPQTNAIVHATLIGGSDQDRLTAVTVDDSGNVYVCGYTVSADFPVTQGAFNSPGTDPTHVNDFVAKLDPTLSTVKFSSLFGGNYHPIPNAIAVDSGGYVYIDGWGSQFMPVSPGAYETSYSGGFMVKFDGKTGARIYLTYLGDGHDGVPGRIVPSSDGSAWVGGSNFYGGVVTTADALEPVLLNPYTNPHYLKHISADGTQQLYALVTDPTNLTRFHDFNAASSQLQPPLITAIVNAASMGQPGFLAPGEIVSIFGLSIGPDQPASYEIDSAGHISSDLHGLQVLMDGLPAPILYASKNQINVIAPFALPPLPSSGSVFDLYASVQVKGPAGAPTLSASPEQVASLPAVFVSPNGAGLILNQDSTTNGPKDPAMQGSIISLFATGIGAMSPVPAEGAIAMGPSSRPTIPVQVFLGTTATGSYVQLDQTAVRYAGDAPGEIEGLQQINVQLPLGAVYSRLYIQVGAAVSNLATFFEE
ncbi:MAG TPA: SBBP repeat-containing protein [Bryobacteraceae bacterium]